MMEIGIAGKGEILENIDFLSFLHHTLIMISNMI
jgi:hypothetical protein